MRGIEVRTDSGQVEYVTKNKPLGEFAKDAYNNWRDYQKSPETLSKEKWVEQNLRAFKDHLQEKLESDGPVIIKENRKPNITALEDDAFRCNRYDDPNDSVLLKDNDIIYGYIGMYMDNHEINIQENPNVSRTARSGMYYIYKNLIDLFKEYLESKKIVYSPSDKNKVELQNYVLIIDEINRANLPAVLGELIYALEYRGEKVESMYAIDEDNSLVLPPNLYIVGTMNTADRSVGQIDYAIRRRFAFVDIVPKNLSDTLGYDFKKDAFEKVSNLFTKEYLSDEFVDKVQEVQIGHSYFIQEYEKDEKGNNDKSKPIDFDMRIEYEIKPILREYVKDGIFKEQVNGERMIDIVNNIG